MAKLEDIVLRSLDPNVEHKVPLLNHANMYQVTIISDNPADPDAVPEVFATDNTEGLIEFDASTTYINGYRERFEPIYTTPSAATKVSIDFAKEYRTFSIEGFYLAGMVIKPITSDDPLAVPGAADATTSIVDVWPIHILNNDTMEATITVYARDADGLMLTVGGDLVEINSDGAGTMSAVTDNNDGSYTATYTSSVIEEVLITSLITDNDVTDEATLFVTNKLPAPTERQVRVNNPSVLHPFTVIIQQGSV